jgi:ribonuclease HII
MDRLYPGYGFAQHKGYATRFHLEALKERGVTALHRKSFLPVRQALQQKSLEFL